MTTRSILLVGGGGKAPPIDGASLPQDVRQAVDTPQALKKALDTLTVEAAKKGYAVRIMQLTDIDDGPVWLESVKAALASQSWDGFIIGNGIRGTPTLTVLFEQLVNIGREMAPDARMGFNTHPLDVLATIERMFAP